ncbi:glucosyltransferase [Rhodosporidiobolus nylandii]
MPSVTWWTAYACYAVGIAAVARQINVEVQEPYMDEIFHVPQAQAYCRGDWRYWDPALTTPPGLYLLPAAISHLQRVGLAYHPSWLFTSDPCSLSSLRSFNLCLSLALPFLYRSILALLLRPSPSPKPSSAAPAEQSMSATRDWEALTLTLFPLAGWWSWLYYTDLGSLVLVLLAWRAGLQGRWVSSAATNIVWLLFIAGQGAVNSVKRRSPHGVYDPPLTFTPASALLRTPLSLLSSALLHPRAFLPVLAPYSLVFGAAGAFVKWNGGVVLGDKANHVATLHVPQVYYFVLFACGFFVAPLLSSLGMKGLVKHTFGLVRGPRQVALTAMALGGMCWSIGRFAIAHPFLLADNRHYAFYLWRRLINVHPLARYALTPVYLLGAKVLYAGLAHSRLMTLSTLLLFLCALVGVLVPTPLLEPRYFITALLILRLYLSPPPSLSSQRRRRVALAAEAALYIAVQAVCVYLFLRKTFVWDVRVGEDGKGLEGRDEREVGRLQRFMW